MKSTCLCSGFSENDIYAKSVARTDFKSIWNGLFQVRGEMLLGNFVNPTSLALINKDFYRHVKRIVRYDGFWRSMVVFAFPNFSSWYSADNYKWFSLWKSCWKFLHERFIDCMVGEVSPEKRHIYLESRTTKRPRFRVIQGLSDSLKPRVFDRLIDEYIHTPKSVVLNFNFGSQKYCRQFTVFRQHQKTFLVDLDVFENRSLEPVWKIHWICFKDNTMIITESIRPQNIDMETAAMSGFRVGDFF